MKKTVAIAVLILMLVLTPLGQRSLAAETSVVGESVQMPNPWRDIAEAEAKELCPGSLGVPEGAENAHWSIMEEEGMPPLVQLSFDLNGLSFTAREQANGSEAADISGMCYTWTAQTEMTLQNWEESAKSGTYYRWIGEDKWADLCLWYDTAKGISYSLGVTAKDLDGFDLQAIAEALHTPPAPAAETGRQDGERFEAVIVLEGMEETVRYEHMRNDTIGFEMDYDYERFQRRSEEDRECFVSVYDEPENPENYLEVTHRAEDADTVAASVRETLSQEYDLLESSQELECAGSCLRIEASEIKGTGRMADQIKAVYIIPASDGCITATTHYAIEGAEGFGRRFSYMLDTLVVAEESGDRRLTDEQALSAIRNYCCARNPDLEEIVKAGEYLTGWEIASSTDSEIVVVFRSYTGAINRYYIHPVSGDTKVTELVPGVIEEEQQTDESLNVWDYLNGVQ